MIDKKMAQHLNMVKDWGLYKLYEDAWHESSKEVDRYERAHGFGYGDEYSDDDYERFIADDEGFNALWNEFCRLQDEMHDCLNRFCDGMVRFTDGQIDFNTAKIMATNPRTAKKLEEIMMGG